MGVVHKWLSCILLLGLLSETFGQWRQKLKNELFLYTGIEGKLEDGWNDGESFEMESKYGIDNGLAEGVAVVNFMTPVSRWVLSADNQWTTYRVTFKDRIVLR